ncbi:hypothetical protein [Alkalisalibacterium limincola]|uniref:Uncharacterized protein n=1 Tax=Alkalisalibacterium limincola TaxID=2699169 RepID=A0A5C8KJU0_9GAMM|nr:hypothetical protein [Alkalisalibacterium limincola]TXK59858.1 hypothetical protein FU658_13015 [Alkalisalibacterium limincola]
MKLNLIAATSIIAAGAMMSGNANAERAVGHIQEIRSAVAAEFEARGGVSPQAIGDLDTGFNPIEPCRVADSRFSLDGAYAAAETRNIVIDTSDLSFQGGNPEGCDIPADASSVALNIVAVRPAADGFLTAFPGGTDRPASSTVNFAANQIIANGAIMAMGDGVDVYMHRAGDVVVDVTGYFADLAANELDCFTTENAGQLAEAGEIFVGFTFCDAGYSAVGGACDQNSTMPMLGAGTFSDFGAHICVFDNEAGTDATAWVDVACCRVQPESAE